MLGTIQKASNVLDLFTNDKHEWGVTEIAVRFGEPKSTVHELLSSLAQIGWLARTDRGRYRLGRRLLTYSGVLLKVPQYGEEARKQLQGLVARFGNSAYLGLLDQSDVVVADGIEAMDSQEHLVSYIGARVPAHSSAFGKVLLAYQPWEAVQEAFQKSGMPAFTSSTITDLDRLKTELDEIREVGYGISMNERSADRTSIAAPVRDQSGQEVAAIGILIDSAHFEPLREASVSAVIAAAKAISTSLGYRPQATPPTEPVVAAEPEMTDAPAEVMSAEDVEPTADTMVEDSTSGLSSPSSN